MDKEIVVEEMEEVEGYKWCATTKERCLNDCWIVHNSLLSDID